MQRRTSPITTSSSRGRAAMTLIAGLALTGAAAAEKVVYVDNNAFPGGDGLAWKTAYEDLQDGLAAAAIDPRVTEIRIAEGVYRPGGPTSNRSSAFEMLSGVSLVGGYAGIIWPDPDLRDPELYPTILSGDLHGDDQPGFVNTTDNSYTVIRAIDLAEPIVIDGVVVTAGNADWIFTPVTQNGGGLYMHDAVLTLIDCAFAGNSAAESGGAIICSDGALTLTSCSFTGNRVTSLNTNHAGGAAIASWSAITLVDCLFEANTAALHGGAFTSLFSSVTTMTGCRFVGNAAQHGGALRSYNDSFAVIDCEFTGNSAVQKGGAVHNVVGGVLSLDGCTFTGNVAATGGAVHAEAEAIVAGASFIDNASTSGGGAIYATAPLCLDTCVFTGNGAGERGGALRTSAAVDAIDCAFVANTASGDGGAIFDLALGDLALARCDFETNQAGGVGGALFTTEGEAWLEECGFVENGALLWGGALYAVNAAATLVDCVLAGNEAGELGGGLLNLQAEMVVDGCRIESNVAGIAGGGLHNWTGGSLTVLSTLVLANEAPNGAGLLDEGEAAQLFSCTLSGNLATSSGGGVETRAGALTAMTSCVLSANVADERGGAVHVSGGALTLANVTMSGNAAMQSAGGVHIAAGTAMSAANTILWANQSAGATGEAAQLDAADPAAVDLSHCIVQGLTGLFGGIGNVDLDPLLRDPAGLDLVAGTADDDLRVSAGSPAIDAGDNGAIPADAADLDGDGNIAEPVPLDRDGHARRFDDPAVIDTGSGAAPLVDLGAYEFDGAPFLYMGAPGGSWFEAGAWSGGTLPGPMSDVVLFGPVVVDGPGAVARSIVIQAGGALRIAGGALTTSELLVQAGGELILDPFATLVLTQMTVATGAELTWNAGSATLAAGGTWTQPDGLAFGCAGPAELRVQPGATVIAPSVDICQSGTLRGDGAVRGAVTNAGLISPGASLGTLTIEGSLVQSAGGTMLIEVRRPSFEEYDRLIVEDAASLAGTLVVSIALGFEAGLGQTAAFLSAGAVTGSFDAFFATDFDGLLMIELLYGTDAAELRFVPPTSRLYVRAAAGAGGHGTAWSSPFGDLEEALTAARFLPGLVDQIWIAEGTYTPSRATNESDARTRTFELVDGVHVYGGFAGTETSPGQRRIGEHPTVLSGDLAGDDAPGFVNNGENGYNVVRGVMLTAPMLLDGIMVTAGNANGTWPPGHDRGGGLLIDGAVVTLRSCTFAGNFATSTNGGDGGGAHLANVQADVLDCTFTSNAGGGLLIRDGAGATITGCVFGENTGTNTPGAGLYLHIQAEVSDCLFSGNGATSGGGLAIGGSEATVSACNFIANTAVLRGGGLHIRGSAIIAGCNLINNSAGDGAGAYAQGESVQIAFEQCAFSNNVGTGSDPDGGALCFVLAHPAVSECTFLSNSSRDGGAIFADRSEPVITDSLFQWNQATFNGGAIHLTDTSNATIERCDFLDSSAGRSGGSIYTHLNSSPTITDCTFRRSSALDGSGGALHFGSGTPGCVGCTFADNSAVDEGGAIACVQSSMMVDRARFFGNFAGLHGGAIWIYSSSSPQIRNSLFSGNSALQRGGAICLESGGLLRLRNSTLAGNTALVGGGGIDHIDPGTAPRLEMDNCILWQNVVPGVTGEAAQIAADPDALVVARYSCIEGLSALAAPGMIGDDPHFVSAAGPDGVVGTEDDDLHLTAASPCINAGDPLYTDESGLEDVDGAPRVQVCRIDMGADETALAHPIDPDCNGNGVVDACELADGTSADCNGDQVPDECEIAAGAAVDCNGNGVPDACDVQSSFSAASMQLSPIGAGSPQQFTVPEVPPAAGPVTLSFTAHADLSTASEHIDVYVDGDEMGTIFQIGSDCAEPAIEAQLIIDEAEFNAMVGTGPLIIAMNPSAGVSASDCGGSSYITVAVDYAIAPTSRDADGDGIPDECAACPADIDGSGAVNVDDLVAVITSWGPCTGCPADIDGDGEVGVDDLVAVVVGWGACR